MKIDWVTVLALLFIIGLVVFDYFTIEKRMIEAVDECNDHWRAEAERVCPEMNEGNILATGEFNITNFMEIETNR